MNSIVEATELNNVIVDDIKNLEDSIAEVNELNNVIVDDIKNLEDSIVEVSNGIVNDTKVFDTITDEIIKSATIDQIDALYRRLSRELCLRRPQAATATLNVWKQSNRTRYVKYWCLRDVDGWAGTLTVINENKERFIVIQRINTRNQGPDNYKMQLRELLAKEMITKLAIL